MFKKYSGSALIAAFVMAVILFSAPVLASAETKQKKDEVKKEKFKELNKDFDDATPPKVDLESLKKSIVYPEKARKNNIQGKVMVRALIDKDGKVTKTKIASTDNKMFNQAAMDAVKSATCEPGKKDGKPVKAWVTLPINFRLDK